MPSIRRFRADDIDDLHSICLATGAAGRDASDLVSDPRLLGDIYAAPYGVLEPEHSLVLVDGAGAAIGYVVGALDTLEFAARLEAEWWPSLRRRHPIGSGSTALDEELLGLLHRPSSPDADVVGRFPSHLHINVLPTGQGGGWGRRLMEAMIDLLEADGSTGLHVGVDPANQRAAAFYLRSGFEPLGAVDDARWFGRPLGV